jgi:hypothetical protein
MLKILEKEFGKPSRLDRDRKQPEPPTFRGVGHGHLGKLWPGAVSRRSPAWRRDGRRG